MANYRFKFLFANYDGVFMEIEFPPETTGLQVKQKLLNESWPAEDKNVEKPISVGGLRLLCMGRMLDDGKTLKESNLPQFDHPTPVNISLLPKSKGTYSEAGGNAAGSTSGKKDDLATTTTTSAAATNARSNGPPNGTCCTVS